MIRAYRHTPDSIPSPERSDGAAHHRGGYHACVLCALPSSLAQSSLSSHLRPAEAPEYRGAPSRAQVSTVISPCPQLSDLVALVRGKLSRMQRAVLSALIVIEVHAKDVVSKLIVENVVSVHDFEWISQLR